MKNEVLLILLIAVLVLSSLPYVNAAVYCPNGDCADEDPAGSACLYGATKPCIGAFYYGSNTGCNVGTSTCKSRYFSPFIGTYWSDCAGWKNAKYQAAEAMCDNVDNDCDGSVDEAALCQTAESCFNGVDDNGNGEVDCQDTGFEGCLYTPQGASQLCISFQDLDVDITGFSYKRIDGRDLDVLSSAYGSRPGDSNWNKSVDFNKDNIVNNLDKAWMDKNFAATVPRLYTCAERPSNITTYWVAPKNVSYVAYAITTLNLGKYLINFAPKPGHNYTAFDTAVNGSCCKSVPTSKGYACVNYTRNEVFTVYDYLGGMYLPVGYQEKLGICGQDSINKGRVQSDWVYANKAPGRTDCSNFNCVYRGYSWQDQNSQCSYLTQDFLSNQITNYIAVPANEAATWIAGNRFYIGRESFTITCVEVAGSSSCTGGTATFDRVLLDRRPVNNYSNSMLAGTLQSCTYGDQSSCSEVLAPGPQCQLTSVSLAPNCSGGSSADCEPGDTIGITADFLNDCGLIDNIQIDATGPAGTNCEIEYSDIPPGSIEITQGINNNISVASSQVTTSWTIPNVPVSCAGVTVQPVTAMVYDGGVPSTGALIDDTSDAGDSVTGSFKFYIPPGVTTVTTTTGTTTSLQGASGGFGVCGDGVINTGEQCEKPGDCIPLGMNDCDMTGLITGFECRCYSTLENQGTETILFTTSCQDVGNGQQGLRTETTKVIDVATGNVLSETSQQVTCSLPPVNVPGFSLVNILLVSSILLIYYISKKK